MILAYIYSGFTHFNTVRTISKGVYSAAECQVRCQHYARRGCKYFVWEGVSCTLFSDLSGLEHEDSHEEDEDHDHYAGPVTGCFGCHREGWDYVVSTAPSNNLSGKGAVYGVASVYKCAQICNHSEDCEHVTYVPTYLVIYRTFFKLQVRYRG